MTENYKLMALSADMLSQEHHLDHMILQYINIIQATLRPDLLPNNIFFKPSRGKNKINLKTPTDIRALM